MEFMVGFYVAIGAAIMFIINRLIKRNEPINNDKVDTEVKELQNRIETNNTSIENHEKAIEQIKKEGEDEKNTKVDSNGLVKFFDDRKS